MMAHAVTIIKIRPTKEDLIAETGELRNKAKGLEEQLKMTRIQIELNQKEIIRLSEKEKSQL